MPYSRLQETGARSFGKTEVISGRVLITGKHYVMAEYVSGRVAGEIQSFYPPIRRIKL
ncbi:MAG: hypothetical protein R3E08_08485 [Thiotrichaceae bacterium]